MRVQKTAIGTATISLSVVIIILAGSFAYYYASTTSQVSTLNAKVSSLKVSGQTLCKSLEPVSNLLSTTAVTLQEQIQKDGSMVAALNSTKPSGYAGMIDTLNSQIAQDLFIINQTNTVNGPGITTGGGPCTPFNQP